MLKERTNVRGEQSEVFKGLTSISVAYRCAKKSRDEEDAEECALAVAVKSEVLLDGNV